MINSGSPENGSSLLYLKLHRTWRNILAPQNIFEAQIHDLNIAILYRKDQGHIIVNLSSI